MEGNRKLVRHFAIERSRALVDAKKAAIMRTKGRLTCEVCNFDFSKMYGPLGDGYCEVHHRQPLGLLPESKRNKAFGACDCLLKLPSHAAQIRLRDDDR